MNLSFLRDRFARAFERKAVPIALAILFAVAMLLGIVFSGTALFYDYLLNLCDRFLYSVCYADRSVFVIFCERTAGGAVLVAVCTAAGVHLAALALIPAVLVYRAYTFGGCIAVFFGAYGVSGAIVALVLYLPVHLMIDFILICTSSVSCCRARSFRFRKQDFCDLLRDYGCFLLLVAAVCLLEAILLLAIFHPLGNLF